MRISIPGVPGVYYDTDAKSTAVTAVLTAAGRYAPKPKGYALQVLPQLWSFDVDLREVPSDHPFQYLHPEGAHSIEELTREQVFGADVGRELEYALQFAWAVNRETEGAIESVIGRRVDEDGLVVEIDDGALDVETGGSTDRRSIEIDDEDTPGVDEGVRPLEDADADEGHEPDESPFDEE